MHDGNRFQSTLALPLTVVPSSSSGGLSGAIRWRFEPLNHTLESLSEVCSLRIACKVSLALLSSGAPNSSLSPSMKRSRLPSVMVPSTSNLRPASLRQSLPLRPGTPTVSVAAVGLRFPCRACTVGFAAAGEPGG